MAISLEMVIPQNGVAACDDPKKQAAFWERDQEGY